MTAPRPTLTTPARKRGAIVAAVVAAASIATACGTAGATAPGANTKRSLSPTAASAALDRYSAIAMRRYDKEVAGAAVHIQLGRLARDPTLLKALRSGDTALLDRYVRRQFSQLWYHWHVSRLRITKGSRVLVEVGVPFALAGRQQTLRDAQGRPLATLQISVQDEIGIVKAMHRHYPVDVVIRGRAAGHVVTLLTAAKQVGLPADGPVTIAGRRYLVRSFRRAAFGGEPVTVWILLRR